MTTTASGGYSAAERLRSGTRDDVRAALLAQRGRTLELAAAYERALGPALDVPYDPGLNPPRWELGHQAWFQEWWTSRNGQRGLGVRCDPEHRRRPPSLPQADDWYDSSRVEHPTRWTLPLPDLEATLAWLASTLQATLRQLDALPVAAGDDELYFFRLAALHEAMHGEAACYMARTLGFEVPGAAPLASGPDAVAQVPAGTHRLGWTGPGFAFDNELGAHEVQIEAFEIDLQPVSWSRFQPFVEAGGYEDARWWTESGWRWKQSSGAKAPLASGHGAALHLSCHEAEAWCRWAGRRLPTEAEWECAATSAPGFQWGQAWEWTASDFQPYPGFVAHPYRDYSQPWFGTRRVLRGAGPATSSWLADPRYRNFFEPHRQDLHAGFRSCAAGAG